MVMCRFVWFLCVMCIRVFCVFGWDVWKFCSKEVFVVDLIFWVGLGVLMFVKK